MNSSPRNNRSSNSLGIHRQQALPARGSRTSLCDVENGERCGTDTPDPVLLAVVFEARFVAAKLWLLGNRGFDFFVGVSERTRNDTGAKLRQVAARDRHLQDVVEVFFDGGVAAMCQPIVD